MNILREKKIVWTADFAQQFIASMHSNKTSKQLCLTWSLTDVDINEALKSFNGCLKQNAGYTKRKTKKLDEWYDEECRAARKRRKKT